jgi:hypothetical protein
VAPSFQIFRSVGYGQTCKNCKLIIIVFSDTILCMAANTLTIKTHPIKAVFNICLHTRLHRSVFTVTLVIDISSMATHLFDAYVMFAFYVLRTLKSYFI